MAHVVAKSTEEPLRFYITNNMFDETKLSVGWPRSQRRSILAWHSQATWSRASGHVEDADIIRPPRELSEYTAAACWSLCGAPTDRAGLYPRGEAMPHAKHKGTLTSFDSHSVNLLLSKFLTATLPADHFHIASLCTQHRTGSVCEEVSNTWGLLPPCFCLAAQTRNGDFYNDLGSTVWTVLNKYLFLRDPAEGPPAMSASEQALCDFAKELLYLCYVATVSDNAERGEEEERVAHAKRKEAADELLGFFLHHGLV